MELHEKSQLLAAVARDLEKLRAERPLVHNITNYVVMNYTANALLALGASPIMAHAPEEVEQLAAMAGALVINIGTLSQHWIDSMFRAGRAARQAGVPVILDPVGAGATALRTETARRLLEQVRPQIVRANASETLALAGESGGKGVDATHTVEEARRVALKLAQRYQNVFAVTGKEDYVTDGTRELRIANGHPLMGRVTGTGCTATAVVAAFAAVESDYFVAAVGGLLTFGIAGELAARGEPRPGTYGIRLLDALDEINSDLLASGSALKN